MRKTTGVLTVLVAGVLAWTAASWYTGKRTQALVVEWVAQVNSELTDALDVQAAGQAGARLEIRNWDRGVFSSSAQYVLHTRDEQGKVQEYVVDDALSHGPLPWARVRAGDFRPALAYSHASLAETAGLTPWFAYNQGLSPLQVHTRLAFDGSGVSEWVAAPLEWMKNDRQIEFSGGHMTAVFGSHSDTVRINGDVAFWRMTDADSRLDIEGIRIETASAGAGTQDGTQTGVLRLASVSTLGMGDADLSTSLEGVRVEYDTVLQGGRLDLSLDVQVDHVRNDTVDLGSLQAGVGVERLDMPALMALQALADYRDNDQDGVDVDADSDEAVHWQSLMPHVRALLGARPHVRVGPLVLKNTAGASTLSLTAGLQDPGRDLAADDDLEWLYGVLEQVRLEAAVNRPMMMQLLDAAAQLQGEEPGEAAQAFAAVFDLYASTLADKGLLTLSDDTLSASLQVSPPQDQVELNGRTMTLNEFMGMVWIVFLTLA